MVMKLAKHAAQHHNHECIGTEHLLLGLVKEGEGVACAVLKNLGVTLEQVRTETEKLMQIGPRGFFVSEFRQTPQTEKVIDYAREEAHNLRHNYVGTEHLLLGLLREQEGIAAQVLAALDLTLAQVREETLNLLGRGMEKMATPTSPQPTAEDRAEIASALDVLSLALSAAAVQIRAGEDCSEDSPLAKKITAALGSLPRQCKF
jgi:ATP-dependent Clp protease ATP-binding subunit ClpA